jgi:cathepsin B
MVDLDLDTFIGSEDEDTKRRSHSSSTMNNDEGVAYVKHALNDGHGHKQRVEWEGAPPSFGGFTDDNSWSAGGTQGQENGDGPRSAWVPPAGHQNNHVRARNAAQLTYPWHLPLLMHTSVSGSSSGGSSGAVPESFDWRTHAGSSKDLLTPVQDQGACGCCWAIAAAQSLADRMRIASLGSNTVIPVLSSEYVKDCATAALGERYDQLLDLGTHGTTGTCASGGCLSMGCEFLANYGAVSSKVLPYADQTMQGEDVGACLRPSAQNILYTAKKGSVAVVTLGPNGHAPASHGQMASTSSNLSSEVIAQNVLNMQKNIMLYGPLAVTFLCYKDLCTTDFDSSQYVDNVYVPDLSSGVDGGHAVTIIGWGVGESQKTPYWIVRNSWGSDWNASMGGYYLHLRGKNASQIESAAVSLQSGAAGGQGRAVNGSDLMQNERKRLEDVSNAGFWASLSTYERAGLVTAVSIGVVIVLSLLIALLVYSPDKGWGWTRGGTPSK